MQSKPSEPSAPEAPIIRTGSDGRLRYSPQQRLELLEAFDRSGQIAMAFARQHGVSYFKVGQTLAAAPLAAIQRIYQIETTLRKRRAAPEDRTALRRQQAAPVLQILKSDLVTLCQRPEVLPKSQLGRAIDYTLGLWERLTLYLEHGELEIDNNWIENGVRPTAIGKKTGSLWEAKPAASAQPSSIRSSNARAVTGTIQSNTSPIFSSASRP